MNLKKYINRLPSLEGQNIVITGTTSGLGLALSELVLQKGGNLIIANRKSVRVEEALARLNELYPNAKITSLYYDQSNTATFTGLINALKALKQEINGFVFNAGVYLPDVNLRTDKGLALTFGINYFGNYYLTEQLFSSQAINNATKLVYTTSIAASKTISEESINHLFNNTVKKRHAEYKLSKTALNIYVKTLMESKENNVYLYHPGVTGTNIVRFKLKFIRNLARFAMNLIFPSPKKAALGALYALTTTESGKNKIIAPRGAFNIVGYPKLSPLVIKKGAAVDALITASKKLNN